MISHELTGTPETGYFLTLREWDGYDKPNYTTLCRLSPAEAACLVKCKYFLAGQNIDSYNLPLIDSRTILQVRMNDEGHEHVVVMLPPAVIPPDNHHRAACEFIDEGMDVNDRESWRYTTGWFDKFRTRPIAQSYKIGEEIGRVAQTVRKFVFTSLQ